MAGECLRVLRSHRRLLWQSTFNAFTPSSKITDLKQLIDQLHASDVRVIFWATSMVNVDCPACADVLIFCALHAKHLLFECCVSHMRIM